MKTRLLFVIGSLQAGGAERSLVSLLNALPKEQYDIDLMLRPKGDFFLPLVPENVHLIEPCTAWQCLGESPTNWRFYARLGLKWWLRKVVRWQRARCCHQPFSPFQDLWRRWREDMQSPAYSYDVAVGYLDGFPNWFVIDSVNAKRKLLWVHNDYDKLEYRPVFDAPYFNRADKVVTISEDCRKSLLRNFPDIAPSKFVVLENISDGGMIRKMAQEAQHDELFDNCKTKRIVSVGRLTEQKNYTLALKAAAKLKERIGFTWFVIGEGDLRKQLEAERDALGLRDNVFFIGLRRNPYYYMRKADCIVMSSLFEGKSIAIDEAKILGCPIVSTNYPTVKDNIVSGVNGLVTELSPDALVDGIFRMLTDVGLRARISESLKNEKVGNMEELHKYMKLFDA